TSTTSTTQPPLTTTSTTTTTTTSSTTSSSTTTSTPTSTTTSTTVPSCTFLAAWGSYGSGNGQFNSPEGVATDGIGNAYVADYSNNSRIQNYDTRGTFLT